MIQAKNSNLLIRHSTGNCFVCNNIFFIAVTIIAAKHEFGNVRNNGPTTRITIKTTIDAKIPTILK